LAVFNNANCLLDKLFLIGPIKQSPGFFPRALFSTFRVVGLDSCSPAAGDTLSPMDAVIGPLNVAAEYVDRISKGDIPEVITDEYKGDFNEIKKQNYPGDRYR